MNSAEPVWVLNPVISQYEKKYIWKLNSQSMKIFKELCSRRIHIDGFVDEEKAGISFFHKPVCSIEDCKHENAVFLVQGMDNKKTNSKICSKIFVLNEKLYKRKVMIYGAGYIGKKICSVLQQYESEVLGFIDSDKDKIGTKIENIVVYGRNILDTLPCDVVVIEAGRGMAEIDHIIRTENDRLLRFYIYDLPFVSSEIWVDQRKNITLGLSCIMPLCEYYEKNKVKELILYGKNISLAKKYAELYECLDFGPVSIMTCEKDKVTENIGMIEEILYKSDYLILLYESDERLFLEKLRELGIERECGYVNFPYSPGFYN